MDRKLIDIEVYPNFFMLGIKDYKTKETFHFEVSEFKDDRSGLINWLSNYKGYVISFNGIDLCPPYK